MNNPSSGGVKSISGLKSLTPAVLGVAGSHGIKISPNITSENKKELLTKLEEWRQARREKLTASILAKQKQFEKSKTTIPVLPSKTKQVPPVAQEGGLKTQNQLSVFERLYKNDGKIKKPGVAVNSSKPSQILHSNFKKSKCSSYEKTNKPVKPLLIQKEKKKFFNKDAELESIIKKVNEKEIVLEKSVKNQVLDSANSFIETQSQIVGDELACSNKKKIYEAVKSTKPDFYKKNDQVDFKELKYVKSDLPIRSSLFKLSSKVGEVERQKNPLRRSISVMFRQNRRTDFGMRRSISAKNIHEINLNLQNPVHKSLQTSSQSSCHIRKKTETEVMPKSVSFITPKQNGLLTSTYLRTKLENWLNVNGHPLEGYRHLRCFGIANNGKSLLKAPATLDNSFENSYYTTAPNTPINDSNKENVTPPTVKQKADVKDAECVENWLKELHRLISEVKYPWERCEEWLTAIRNKHSSCTHLPIYWECLAALHESKGDLKSAIEDYERAIVKGGEIDEVGNSLAELFDKLIIDQKKNSQKKLEKGLDPKNIFKSTIIKFALQQKALKKLSSQMEPSVKELLYIATPVRRSTRIQTPFKSTEVDSLQNLTPELLKSVEFKPNESLLSGN